jgi:hypothetical protein
MLSSKKYTLWGLKSNRKPLEPKKGNLLVLKIRSEILRWAQKSILYGVW